MNINMNRDSGLMMSKGFLTETGAQKNSPLKNLQKGMRRLEQQIADIKDNDDLSARDKEERIKGLEERKEELRVLIMEEQMKEKMEETEKKMEEAEEREEKRREQELPTPLEELKAELGMNKILSKPLIRASKNLDDANMKFRIAEELRREARILNRQAETDRGRGQSVNTNDFRVKRVSISRTRADMVEADAMGDLEKANADVKKAGNALEKEAIETQEIKNKLEEEQRQDDSKGKEAGLSKTQILVGERVDIKL